MPQDSISYHLLCHTLNRGLKALEAFPRDQRTKICDVNSEETDQVWVLKSMGKGFQITCSTRNCGLRCLEAFPNSNEVRVVALGSSKDQIWYTEQANEGFRVYCNTQNGGKRYLEAFPKDNWARPGQYNESNIDQIWIFNPIKYYLHVLVNDATYHSPMDSLKSKHHTQYIEEKIITNDSKAEVIGRSTYSKEIKRIVQLSFKEGFAVGAKVKFSAGLPLICSVDYELSLKAFVEFNQEYTTETTEKIELSKEVKVPPQSGGVKVTFGVEIMDKVEAEATLGLKITARGSFGQKYRF